MTGVERLFIYNCRGAARKLIISPRFWFLYHKNNFSGSANVYWTLTRNSSKILTFLEILVWERLLKLKKNRLTFKVTYLSRKLRNMRHKDLETYVKQMRSIQTCLGKKTWHRHGKKGSERRNFCGLFFLRLFLKIKNVLL